MKEPVLIILAAGMGSRYGGLKQIDTVGSNGESIIDFSIYDAIQAGFKHLILIIKREHEEAFEESLVKRLRPFINVRYAYQELEDLPEGFEPVTGRQKPYGTVHALLACKGLLAPEQPFMVINADDFYGRASYVLMHQFLSNEVADGHYGMVGYVLKNTLTNHGHVTRAICQKEGSYLKEIVEIQKIAKQGENVVYEEDGYWLPMDGQQICSMNYWGFTPHIFDQLEPLFIDFLNNNLESNPMKCEYVIPTAIGQLVDAQEIQVKVYASPDRWFGVTYQEDKPEVVENLERFKDEELYPFDLWKV